MTIVAAVLTVAVVIGSVLPYAPDTRFVLIVFALAIAGWTVLKIDDTLVALGAVTVLFAGGAIPISAAFKTITNPLIALLIAAFVISAALSRSGLAERAVSASIGQVRSVQGMFHALGLLILSTAFIIPSTTGRAALFLPVFLTLSASIRDAKIVRALALLFPSVILLSACASLTGAGAHLFAAEFIARAGGPVLDYASWALLGLPFALASSVAATCAILWLFLDRETRAAALRLPRIAHTPLDRDQRIVFTVVGATLVALFGATALGIHPAFVAAVAALTLMVGPFRVLGPSEAAGSVEWKLIGFLIATMLMGEALVAAGAAHAVAAHVVASAGLSFLGSPLATATMIAAVALLSHLVITSRTARVVILVPVIALPLAALGYDPTALAWLIAIGTGFCQTLPASAKAVALFAALKQPTYSRNDLAVLSAVLLPVHLVLLVTFASIVWPLLGAPPLKP